MTSTTSMPAEPSRPARFATRRLLTPQIAAALVGLALLALLPMAYGKRRTRRAATN